MLGLDCIDLYLVHAPPEDIEARAGVGGVWKNALLADGLNQLESVMVAHHLDDMLSDATILPAVNQVNYTHGISPCSSSSNRSNRSQGDGLLAISKSHKVDDNLAKIAKSLDCTPAQAAIKWV